MDREIINILWSNMKCKLNELQRRQYAATLAKAYGYGGATIVHEITGVSLNTITAGKKELEQKMRRSQKELGKKVRERNTQKKNTLIFVRE